MQSQYQQRDNEFECNSKNMKGVPTNFRKVKVFLLLLILTVLLIMKESSLSYEMQRSNTDQNSFMELVRTGVFTPLSLNVLSTLNTS